MSHVNKCLSFGNRENAQEITKFHLHSDIQMESGRTVPTNHHQVQSILVTANFHFQVVMIPLKEVQIMDQFEAMIGLLSKSNKEHWKERRESSRQLLMTRLGE
jgi:hypothetical protein